MLCLGIYEIHYLDSAEYFCALKTLDAISTVAVWLAGFSLWVEGGWILVVPACRYCEDPSIGFEFVLHYRIFLMYTSLHSGDFYSPYIKE